MSNESLLDFARTTGKKQRQQARKFEERMRVHWGDCLDLLHLMILNGGEAVNDRTNRRDPSTRAEALHRLHMRAHRVGLEIHNLLGAGYPLAAFARWRTMHEIAAVTALIFNADQGDELSESYLSRQYDRRQRDYDWTKGWGMHFKDLEWVVDLEARRPDYVYASQEIHADARALLFHSIERDGQQLQPAGAMNVGIAEPAHLTAISYLQVSLHALYDDESTRTATDVSVGALLLQQVNLIGEAGLAGSRSVNEAEMNYRWRSAQRP